MGLIEGVRLLGLLQKLAAAPEDRGPDRRVLEERDRRFGEGLVHDRFGPRRGRPLGVVIALHGATLNGKDDGRLQSFARSLALSKVIAVTPRVEGLASLDWSVDDVESLSRLICDVAAHYRRPVLVLGFSYGASLGLLAAASDEAAPHVRGVLCWGAYHQISSLTEWYLLQEQHKPRNDDEWDSRVYLHLILAWRHREALGLSDELQQEIRQRLLNYCHKLDLPGEKRFYEEHLQPLDLARLEADHHDRDEMLRVSPAGQLNDVTFPVGLIHDPNDTTVPPSQARALFAELQGLNNGKQHRLLVTSLFDHVSLVEAFDLKAIARMAGVMSPLVRRD